mgnify:FL=1|tara:strand:- start:1844 stop:3151 length:1308 start_codon:yes stop_codon:yes gene_type:complete
MSFEVKSFKPSNVFYGWWLVGVSGLVMTLATVPLYHAMAIWAVALESSFGWSRTQIGFALTFTRIEGGFMGPLEGYLTDKLGSRRMILIGLLILSVGFLIFWQVNSLWTFYLAFIVMALGQGLGSWLPLMTALNNWFVRNRSKAMGFSNMGSRIGALILVPAIAWSIDPEHDRLGWELTALILGIVTLILAIPLSKAIRDRPQDYGQGTDGDQVTEGLSDSLNGSISSHSKNPTAVVDLTAKQAVMTPAFWLISFGHGFTSMVILAIMAHLGLLLMDKGFDIQTTGWVVTVYTAVAMAFQLVGGYLGDIAPKNRILFFFTTLQAVGVLVLTYADSLRTIYLFAVLFGAGFGGRNPLTTSIRGEYFGRASFGKILGLSTVPMNVLLLFASPFAGYIKDVQGSYANAFLILALLNFIGGICFLLAKRPSLMQDTVSQ